MFGSDIGASFVIGRVSCTKSLRSSFLGSYPGKESPMADGPKAACLVLGEMWFLSFVFWLLVGTGRGGTSTCPTIPH